MAKWQEIDVEIHNGTIATTGITKDISAHVGLKKCIVYLTVVVPTDARIASYPVDDADNYMWLDSSPHSCFNVDCDGGKKHSFFGVTNSLGEIGLDSSSGTPVFQVRLQGFCECSVGGGAYQSGLALAGSMVDMPSLASFIGTNDAFLLLKYLRTDGGGTSRYLGVRPDGDTDNYITANSRPAGMTTGLFTSSTSIVLVFGGIAVDGVIEHGCTTTPAPVVDIDILAGEVDNYKKLNVVLLDGAPASWNTWIPFDLSSHVGSTALVFIKVEQKTSPHVASVTVRPNDDDVDDWLLATTEETLSSRGLALVYFDTTRDVHCILASATKNDGLVDLYFRTTAGSPSGEFTVTLVGAITSGPSIVSVVPSYLGLRVTFSEPMVNNDALIDPSTYSITVANPEDDVDFGCIAVVPSGETSSLYVDLVMTDCTDGSDYTLVIVPDVLRTLTNDLLSSGSNTIAFIGVSELPIVLSVQSVSPTLIRVNFSKTMAVNDDYKNKNSYVFTDNLKVLQVELETSSSVLLTTTEQIAGHIYDLTVV